MKTKTKRIGVILESSNLDGFKLRQNQQPVNPVELRKIRKVMKAEGWEDGSYITTNENLEVIKGEDKFIVARELGLPVRYLIIKGEKPEMKSETPTNKVEEKPTNKVEEKPTNKVEEKKGRGRRIINKVDDKPAKETKPEEKKVEEKPKGTNKPKETPKGNVKPEDKKGIINPVDKKGDVKPEEKSNVEEAKAIIDGLQKFVKEKNPHYVKLDKFIKKYPEFRPTESMMLVKNGISSATREVFQKGDFKTKSIETAMLWGDNIRSLKPYFEDGYNKSIFVRAMIREFLKPDFNFTDFLEKVQKNPQLMKKCKTVNEYVEMIEGIRNIKVRKPRKEKVGVH